MQKTGKITVRGIVQGVGFRPFVYAQACALGIAGSVKNLGSEVEIFARGEQFDTFLGAVSRGPPLSRIDSVEVICKPQGNPGRIFHTAERYRFADRHDPPRCCDLWGVYYRYLPQRRKIRKLLGNFVCELRTPV